ncbi:MAG: hypothetical protein MPEBLZ_03416 [Candidatus Methanoperedens nitroreducens]|uniref:DUF4352 domain-containing protein n=1 Tax=Candidatus Methanoperedens nitratireducens TaxID=1392998 RepID=A0A0P8DWL8_9EURY|nr:hypothetical protein [Candidatus Methanoperedens sp. BLZ2]KAB2940758.1 MAG: hypothetical protein F9K14_19055 [Candidatus Methanoperedens sp.]KPQ42029.1 MAG: hypothetical protein MPEBLZ_03416 [Candidatus Methanoperedens sp. BLZ1]MBZ0176256.1 hypothetical protein [Candidatus Methanoperedens nitroreducens]CAG0982253.1 hypothetical protein METP2_02047 [Methanosarcinales archaeon]MCX9077275.1 hypothetical protein [Candidatus Methanoperedens sp.]
MRASGIIIVLFILIIAAVSGCLSGNEPKTETATVDKTSDPDSLEKKVNSEAGVTVTAVYLGSSAFDVKLDTHSGSLDYEMADLSYIRDNKGNIIKPESWDGGIGGHHFEGILKFPGFDDSAGFELVIQDVAGVKERVLKW